MYIFCNPIKLLPLNESTYSLQEGVRDVVYTWCGGLPVPETPRLGKYTQYLWLDSAWAVIQIFNEFPGMKLLQNGFNAERLFYCICFTVLYHNLKNQKVQT